MDKYNDEIFNNNITNIAVIYRNYYSKQRESELIKIACACKKYRYKLFVSNDRNLALKVKADGIYIPSFNKKARFLNLENKLLTLLGSAHNQKEINEKITQKCKAIFIAPLFNVKKKRKSLGLYKFNMLAASNKINALALGGINETNINKLKNLNIKGFGGIGLFKKKTGLKKGRFFKD